MLINNFVKINMGSLTSRQDAGVEQVDIVSNHAYKYPPRSGFFFFFFKLFYKLSLCFLNR